MRRLLLLFAILLLSAVFLGRALNLNPFEKPFTCANSISCVKDLSGKFEEEFKGVFNSKAVNAPSEFARIEEKAVLGQNVGANKHIFIDLTNQMLHAFENDRLVFSFPVSTGKWWPTPTGDYRIWIKLRYTRMAGGDSRIGTYYNLPNVPHVMYFYNADHPKTQGFGLHGAYWHNNFGRPMSHGCVNISLDNAGKLYDWANPPTLGNLTYATTENPGTPLTVYGVTPAE